jgi:uncharacterized protein
MNPNYYPQSILARSRSRRGEFRLIAQKLKVLRSRDVDEMFYRLHKNAFKKIDCLSCANCCRGLGPRITKTDIQRIALAEGLSELMFMENNLHIDEDGDYVFKNMPCPFLQENNLCRIYDVRPRACREYPHTDQKNMKSILNLCLKNTETCPAVLEIFEKLIVELRNE